MSFAVLKHLDRLRRDTRGSIALMLALLVFALVCAAGSAIDYSKAASARTTVQNAADAAALAASKAAADYISTNGWSSSTIQAANAAGVAAAKAVFTANIGSTIFTATPTVTPVLTIVSGQPIVTTLTVTAAVPTSIMQIAGVNGINVNTTSAAQAGTSVKYFQFVFLVDVSGSMTIGGTSNDITLLTSTYNTYFRDSGQCQATKTNFTSCAFACHDPNNVYPCSTYPDKKTRRTTAKAKSVMLKIDYVTKAIGTFLSTVDTAVTEINGDSVASIYTFATNFTALASNVTMSAAKTAATSSIQIETIIPGNNWGYTYTTNALNSLASKLTNVGDGTSSTKRKTYVVFLSDGLEDIPGNMGWGRSTDVSYTSGCTKVKNLSTDLTLVSIEATYPVITGDNQYNTIVAPFSTSMPVAMKACASGSAWYFSADDGPSIETAMASVIAQITKTLRITK